MATWSSSAQSGRLAGLCRALAALCTLTWAAGFATAEDHQVSHASAVSRGKMGAVLRWGTTVAAESDGVRPVAAAEPLEIRSPSVGLPAPPAREQLGGTVANDPFGDRTPGAASPSPPAALPRTTGSAPTLPTPTPGQPRLPVPLIDRSVRPPVPQNGRSAGDPLPPLSGTEDPGYAPPLPGVAPPLPLPEEGGAPDVLPTPYRTGPNQAHRQCPSRDDKEFADFFKTIRDLTTDISAKEGEFPKECEVVRDPYQPRQWVPTDFHWKASGLCHKPLYFEDRNLERYGQTLHPWAQPAISHARFFLTLPILPYKMGLEPPNECIYSLGYYRPGNCAPHFLDPIPLSVRAGLLEAGAWIGGVAIIP